MKVIVVENGTRTELEFDREVISVGRAIDNDIRLSGTLVSRHHCRIEESVEGPWVIDLGSANGTSINGERIKRCLLSPGADLTVGGASIEVQAGMPGDTQLITRRDAIGHVGQLTHTGEAQQERENLRVFARITRELVKQTDLGRLLRQIVDNAVSLAGGERGFLLQKDAPAPEGGDASNAATAKVGLKVKVARSFDREDISIPTTRLSTGIAKQVLDDGRAVLSVDAGRDERFKGMKSVEDLRLRSVMCVPIDVDGKTSGVLYIDNRLQHGAFAEDDLELVALFADQAAIAIKNARFLAELRERNERLAQSARKIQLLNEQLGRKVRDQGSELAVVRAELGRERGRYDYGSIVGASEGMRQVFQTLDRIIGSELPVMIHGESGTGKELIARAVHFNGPRKEKPFVTENCAALPDSLLESELFGHARGAFTGAHKTKKGLLEQAHGGTLFLDEIGDMSPEMQKKLLRVLQEGEFRSLGSNTAVTVDVRVIAASHRDLEEMVRAGTFREDLYYRINVLSVDLPPLRRRREDIPLLAEHLLARAAREAGRPAPHLPREVVAALVEYEWPGNVRELENEMRRLVVMVEDVVQLDQLSAAVQERRSLHADPGAPEALAAAGGNIRDAVAELEQRSIEVALEKAGGNKSRAAESLGISRFALQRKLDKYGLSKRGKKADGAPR